MLLSQYQTQVRRLLNDAQKNYWPDSELTDYINDARAQLVSDTVCVRKFQLGTLKSLQEQYEYTDVGLALPVGNQVVDIINISVIWGQVRYQLGYLPFTMLSLALRNWVNYQRIPVAFTIYNATSFFVAYVPDIDYQAEFDTAIRPLKLVNDNSVDQIPDRYDQAVKFYAAYQARFKLQQYAEADRMRKEYEMMTARLGAMPPRRIPYAFENEVF